MSRATRKLQRQYEALTGQAEALRERGRTAEALARYREALEGAERLAAADGRHTFDVLRLRADIEVQEGIAQLARGWGASAVLHLDRAVNGHLYLLRESGRRADERQLALVLSRSLLVNAEALMRYGDPQLAAAAADLGFRGYLGQHRTRGWNVAHMGVLATNASAILARAGRLADAIEADAIAVKAVGERAEGSGTGDDRRCLATTLATWSMHLLATGDTEHRQQAAACLADARALDAAASREAQEDWERIQASPPAITLADALRVAEQELGQIPADLPATYTDPPTNVVSPSGRTDPHLAAIDAAKLAGIAVELLPRSPAEGLRIGLEGHYLFAAGALTAPLGERAAAVWVELILACCRVLDDEPDPSVALPLAVDLASHNIPLIDALLPTVGDNSALGRLLRDCVDHHAQLLDRAGDQASAEQLRLTAAGLGPAS
ncbi:hypothetical protein ACFP2T_07435 [Plantactinospora solaniradicis]|uniref:Tetratricopeptide repeat protein n=1 Tax=Plantactinospora solaniradicis TaxID=1723736 RepID=A0ABW1K507_9ACTN